MSTCIIPLSRIMRGHQQGHILTQSLPVIALSAPEGLYTGSGQCDRPRTIGNSLPCVIASHRLAQHILQCLSCLKNLQRDVSSANQTPIWLWIKNRYPKWHPGKWKQRLKFVVPWWFNFDPYPCRQYLGCSSGGCLKPSTLPERSIAKASQRADSPTGAVWDACYTSMFLEIQKVGTGPRFGWFDQMAFAFGQLQVQHLKRWSTMRSCDRSLS